jgi:hypothetical protein
MFWAHPGTDKRYAKGARLGRQALREERQFYLFIAPWLVGFLIWTAGPMVYSLYISFTDWDVLTKPVWVGLDNYAALWHDLFEPSRLVLFRQSLIVTTLHGRQPRWRHPAQPEDQSDALLSIHLLLPHHRPSHRQCYGLVLDHAV